MIMIVWVNRRVYYEHYLVHKKKETLRLLWKLLGTQKRKLKTLWTLWFTKKVPPQDYELTWYTKNFFRDVMKLLGQPKKIFRKVLSYFVNLLQNNKKFAVTLYLKSFCEHLTKVLLTFRRIGGVVMNAQRFIKSNR